MQLKEPVPTPEDKIIDALKQSDRIKGDLLEASGCLSYTELDAILRELILKDEIEFFSEGMGYRAYRLKHGRISPVPVWMKKDRLSP